MMTRHIGARSRIQPCRFQTFARSMYAASHIPTAFFSYGRPTNHMREAFAVLDAWGFQQKTMLTWLKDKMGMGDWLRGKTEHCLLDVRGRPTTKTGVFPEASVGVLSDAIELFGCDDRTRRIFEEVG